MSSPYINICIHFIWIHTICMHIISIHFIWIHVICMHIVSIHFTWIHDICKHSIFIHYICILTIKITWMCITSLIYFDGPKCYIAELNIGRIWIISCSRSFRKICNIFKHLVYCQTRIYFFCSMKYNNWIQWIENQNRKYKSSYKFCWGDKMNVALFI